MGPSVYLRDTSMTLTDERLSSMKRDRSVDVWDRGWGWKHCHGHTGHEAKGKRGAPFPRGNNRATRFDSSSGTIPIVLTV